MARSGRSFPMQHVLSKPVISVSAPPPPITLTEYLILQAVARSNVR